MIRTSTILSLLGLFLLQSGGYYLIYWHIESSNRERIRALPPPQKLIEVVKIPLSQSHLIVFKDHGKEFTWQGQMYDILEKRVEKGEVVFVCIEDKKEKKYHEFLLAHTRNQSGSDRTGGETPIKLMGGKLTLYPSLPGLSIPSLIAHKAIPLCPHTNSLISICRSVPEGPPPDIA